MFISLSCHGPPWHIPRPPGINLCRLVDQRHLRAAGGVGASHIHNGHRLVGHDAGEMRVGC
ncbi:MAG: hypothetical protein P1S60_13070 [Anaerolineae bacterium]|nr:hypothetical protein [Anaerolineae bacterium]